MSENNHTSLIGPGSRVKHPAFGDGVIVRLHAAAYECCFMLHGLKMVGKEYDKWDIVEAIPTEEAITFSEAEKSLIRILRHWNGFSEVIEIGERWRGGSLVMQPQDSNLKAKEVPIDTFFHKIVMMRDRLRVMEQRINSSRLSDDEKVDLQQYITRIYGSLTTFNILFKDKEDYFIGEKS
jgi:hypothetical protein